ncbi:SDR family oxidoreductase, partial [uncultured Halomonas sp.]|uniref:SDR family NAD(P)-dependent oxidoreductase n=1 Tax=uncultured Halomonas sp. TaxID=173971 RepID=UPI002630DDE5
GMPAAGGLVNLVGVSRGKPIEQLEDNDWAASFDINVTPAMRLIRLVAPGMRTAGAGSIVNVGSPVGLVGANKPSYAASKAALHGLTMSAARNLGSSGVRVNLLLPGPTITEMTRDWPEERRRAVAQGTFLKRLCQPEEIADMIAFLLGDRSTYLTGSVIDMTAGSLWGH